MKTQTKLNFRHLCMTIGNLPSSYVESLSYYECMLWLCNYLETVVVPTVNGNAEAVEELQDLYIQLRQYVDSYLNDEHLQPMINEKLDEMAEDGTLADIVAQYVQLQGLLTYNSVAEMKTATNIALGSFLQTYGYYSNGDGGGAKYKARNVTNDDVIDNKFIIALDDNTLVAELITTETINVKQLGAKADDTTDDLSSIQSSLDKLNYAYLTPGNYYISDSIVLDRKQSIYGDNSNNTVIRYVGNNSCIKTKDVQTCIEVSVHDLTLTGEERTGTGLYLYRTTKQGDAFHNIYNLKITLFNIGIGGGQYQNETKFNNLYITQCVDGIYLTSLNDCYFTNITSCVNQHNGMYLQSSSETRISSSKLWYNGSTDNSKYNLLIRNCGAIMIDNIGLQESYGTNLGILYSNNIYIENIYLSWPGLGNPSKIYQVYIEESNKIRVIGASQNGHYGETGYDNYILGLKTRPNNCTINIKTEEDFPTSHKIYLDGPTCNVGSVFTKNDINIETKPNKYNKNMNYVKNGNLANTSTLSFINNNVHCTWVDGKIRVDTTNDESNVFIYFQLAPLPREDNYISYVKFKKVSGSGQVLFPNPAYATVSEADAVGTEYYVSYVNNFDTSKTWVDLLVKPGLVIDIIEIGLTLGESGQFDNPMNVHAIV